MGPELLVANKKMLDTLAPVWVPITNPPWNEGLLSGASTNYNS